MEWREKEVGEDPVFLFFFLSSSILTVLHCSIIHTFPSSSSLATKGLDRAIQHPFLFPLTHSLAPSPLYFVSSLPSSSFSSSSQTGSWGSFASAAITFLNRHDRHRKQLKPRTTIATFCSRLILPSDIPLSLFYAILS